MRVTRYVHASREQGNEIAEKLGLKGDVADMASRMGYEEKLHYELNIKTGESELIGANGFLLSDTAIDNEEEEAQEMSEDDLKLENYNLKEDIRSKEFQLRVIAADVANGWRSFSNKLIDENSDLRNDLFKLIEYADEIVVSDAHAETYDKYRKIRDEIFVRQKGSK